MNFVQFCSTLSWKEPVKKNKKALCWNHLRKKRTRTTSTIKKIDKKANATRPETFGSISSPGLHTWRKLVRILNEVFYSNENDISKHINRFSKIDTIDFMRGLMRRVGMKFKIPEWETLGTEELSVDEYLCDIMSFISGTKILPHMICNVIMFKKGASYRFNDDMATLYDIPVHGYWLGIGEKKIIFEAK